jgi:hypothetical protein
MFIDREKSPHVDIINRSEHQSHVQHAMNGETSVVQHCYVEMFVVVT